VIFGPALVSDRSFAFRDAGHFYYPLFQWCCREWASGRVPLWNPLENCGVPVLADVTSSVFYPGKLIFLLPLEFAFRFKLYIILHVVWSACGSYWLARDWKATKPAAALAAIAYSCGGSVVFQYSNIVFLVGAAWLPFAALAADRMLRDRSWMAASWLAVVLALMILGGDPQMAYHALLITGLYCVVLFFLPIDELSLKAGNQPRGMRDLLVRVGLLCLAAAAAYLLAAVQIMPSNEALQLSDRAAFDRPRNIYEAAAAALQSSDQLPLAETRQQSILRGLFGEPEERSHHELAYDFSIGPWRLVEHFWPNISGRKFPTHHRWLSLLPGEGRIWTPTLYMGLLPILLALSVFRLHRGPARDVWLSAIAIIFTLGGFGTYGVGWLLREIWPTLASHNPDHVTIGSPVGGIYWLMLTLLPNYVYFRYPAKLLPIAALAISQLAATGFDQAAARANSRLKWVMLAIGFGSAVLAAIVWCAGVTSSGNFAQRLFAWCVGQASFAKLEWSDPSFGPLDALGAYQDTLFALIQTAVVALLGWWSLCKMASGRPTFSLLLVLLTAVEIAVANSWLVVTAPLEVWRGEPLLAASIQSSQNNAGAEDGLPPRVFRASLATWRPTSFSTTRSTTRPAEIVRWEHDTLFPKHPLASNLALAESYGSIKSADYESLLRVAKTHGPRQRDKSLLPQPSILRLLNTEFLVLPDVHRPDFADRVADALLSKSGSASTPSTNGQMPEGAALWRMTRTLPRVWIVHKVEVMPALASTPRNEAIDRRTYDVLFPNDRTRDFAESAVIETHETSLDLHQLPRSHGKSPAEAVADRCQITHYSPQRVLVEAELQQPGLLVLGDSWYAGWKAIVTPAVSQEEVPIYRTNRVLRGIRLPAGKHTVEFRFQPQSFLRGAIFSGFSWPALAIALIAGLISRRRRMARVNPSHSP
jgi:hypothetical protein